MIFAEQVKIWNVSNVTFIKSTNNIYFTPFYF